MSEEQQGMQGRIRAAGGQVASGLAEALISSPVFGQAVSVAAAARDRAIEVEGTVRGALNLSSQEDADRLERRIRVLSDRLEETEDRLDDAVDELRVLRARNRSNTKPEVEGEPAARTPEVDS